MRYNFTIYSDFNKDTDYDEAFGKYIGNVFADTMEECLFGNSWKKGNIKYKGIKLDGTMSLSQYLAAVHELYSISKGKHPKSEIPYRFKLTENIEKERFITSSGEVTEEPQAEKNKIIYKDISDEVWETIVWGAFYLSSIKMALASGEIPAFKILMTLLIDISELPINDFQQKNQLWRLYEHTESSTIKKINEKISLANAARQKKLEENSRSMQAIYRVQKEMEAKWPNPKRIKDNKVYTIESPEILEYAKDLTPLQTEILRQLVANAGKINEWQKNSVLNQYSEQEIWEACCPLYINNIILAFIEYGHVSALRIEDKGKLVLRKKNSMGENACFVIPNEDVTLKVVEEKPDKSQTGQKTPKNKPAKQKTNKVKFTTTDYICTPDNIRNKRINAFAIAVNVMGYTAKRESERWFKFFSGEEHRCNINWGKSASSATFLIQELKRQKIISLGKSSIASLVTKQLNCERADYRGASNTDKKSIKFAISILDQTKDLSDLYKPGTTTIDNEMVRKAWHDVGNKTLSIKKTKTTE